MLAATAGFASALAVPLEAYGVDRGGPNHDGLLLRLAIGVGGAAASVDETPEVELSGGAGFFSLDLGGTLAPRLALHGRLSAHSVVDPTVSIDGDEIGELEDSSLSFGLLGIGLTYYPSNLYLTGVIGASVATLEIDGIEEESETGVGFNGDVGYEWPVGGDLGLGVAGRIEVHSIPTEGSSRLTGVALGILFSMTYH
jgi:hypothetical protein